MTFQDVTTRFSRLTRFSSSFPALSRYNLLDDPFARNEDGELIQKLPAEVPKRIQYRTVVVLPTPQLAAEMLLANRKFYDQFPGKSKGYAKNC
jgi:hypothetical protein